MSKQSAILGFVIGAVVVGAAWAAAAGIASPPIGSEMEGVYSAAGKIQLDHMVRTSDTNAEGGTMRNVTAIEFHPNYVVVKRRDGGGEVFFAERTIEFRWRLAE